MSGTAMTLRHRFLAAYALLAVLLAGIAVATWRVASMHQPRPLAPGAVQLVERFLGALQAGDLTTACRLFSAFPSCEPGAAPRRLNHYDVMSAQPAVGGVDVPATIDGDYALFSIGLHLGRYRIVDVVADPAPFTPAELSALLAQ
jgi:hypothetical protein